jgi:hypothetical protein
MRKMQTQGFLYEDVEHRLIVATTAKEAVVLLKSF